MHFHICIIFIIYNSFGFGSKKNDERYKTFTITITSSEHGLDANDSVRSNNATFNITSGKDGIHSDNSDDTSLGFVYVENGTFNITSEGDGISASAYAQIQDGTFIGTGAATMAQTLTGANQGVLTFNANGSSGSQVEVKDSNGKTVAVFTPSLSYQYLVVTNDEIVSGQTYTVSIGENSMTVTAE